MNKTPETSALLERIDASTRREMANEVRDFSRMLARREDVRAVLFYGSNLRTGSLDGVLDFYVLTSGPRERGIWPTVSYREMDAVGVGTLRAKVATMALSTFAHASSGAHLDTTIWARFVQPVALAWARDDDAHDDVIRALTNAAMTAGRHAAALGPDEGTENDFWRALFRATYRAELRVEKQGREDQILTFGSDHFEGLLPLAWLADGIAFSVEGSILHPHMTDERKADVIAKWRRRRRMGKPLNVARLLRAATTFEGGARYLAWKIKRHSGIEVPLTPFRERHPLLCAPVLLGSYWRQRRRQRRDQPRSGKR